VAQIYEHAKQVYRIIGPELVILAKDETKVKDRIAWNHLFDTLVGFYGPKEDHVCVSNYKVVVDIMDTRYNNIVDGFHSNHYGAFVRIIMINLLY